MEETDEVSIPCSNGPMSFHTSTERHFHHHFSDSDKICQGRPAVLAHLRGIMEDLRLPAFDPDDDPPALLLKINYNHKGKLVEPDVTRGDVLGSLDRLLPSQHPLARLRYVDGLKFTFGNHFVSRESQGEFVFLDLNKDYDFPTMYWHLAGEGLDRRRAPQKEENYFQLECRDEGIWISTNRMEGLCASAVVAVNGVVLGSTIEGMNKDDTNDSMVEQKLAYGDIITVACGDHDEERQRRFCDLIFKTTRHKSAKVQLDTIVPETNENANALNNYLVVQKILAFCPTETIQQLRSLSHVWNTEGLKILGDRVILTIYERCHHYFGSDDNMQICDYVYSQLCELNFPNWKMELPDGGQWPTTWQREQQRKKILNDLKWLSSLQAYNKVKSLNLSGKVESDLHLEMFKEVLCGVKNTLTALTLNMDFHYDFPKSFPAIGQIPGLSFLSLSLDSFNYSSPWESFTDTFLSVVNNIQTLILIRSAETRPHHSASFVLDHIGKMQKDDGGKFANLTKIAITSSECHLQALSSLRKDSLKKLVLGGVSHRSGHLGRVLQRHANSLESLTIHFQVNTLRLKINFPERMRCLRSLSLLFRVEKFYSRHNVRFWFGQRDADPTTRDPRDRLDYSSRFPSLSKLRVMPVEEINLSGSSPRWILEEEDASWNSFLPILTAFLPDYEGGRVVPVQSVRSLDIPFELKGKYHDCLDDLGDAFPNVAFPPELEEMRQNDDQPRWNDDNDDEPSASDWLEIDVDEFGWPIDPDEGTDPEDDERNEYPEF